MRALLRLPDFRLLFVGLVASMVGDSLMFLVSAIWVKTLTGSSGAAGLVVLFLNLPFVVALFGGWLIDRFRRRRFLVAVNAVSSLMLLPLFAVHGADDVWLIYAVMTLYGLSLAANSAALNGLIKELLADELLARGNGMLQTVKEGLRLGGPLIGRLGELVATGIGLAAFGVGAAVCAVADLPAVLAGACLDGVGLPIAIVGITTVLQRRTPAPLMGRVSVAADALLAGPQTVSIAAGSMLVSLIDYRLLLASVFLGTLAAAIHLGRGRGMMSPPPVKAENLYI